MAEKITKRSVDYAQWYLDVVNQNFEYTLDVAHSQQHFQVCKVAIVTSEHYWGRIPSRAVNQRHKIVIPRLVVGYRRGLPIFFAITPYQN